ncbi:MAG TPA: hypothetical protein VN837_03000, partial [Chloroflexota bacterium]|nr:hypothetical protein [Chloroflexota bacterium]
MRSQSESSTPRESHSVHPTQPLSPHTPEHRRHSNPVYPRAGLHSGIFSPADLLALQRTVGNAAVNQLLQRQAPRQSPRLMIQREIS